MSYAKAASRGSPCSSAKWNFNAKLCIIGCSVCFSFSSHKCARPIELLNMDLSNTADFHISVTWLPWTMNAIHMSCLDRSARPERTEDREKCGWITFETQLYTARGRRLVVTIADLPPPIENPYFQLSYPHLIFRPSDWHCYSGRCSNVRYLCHSENLCLLITY